jgi:hypothetical protein
MVTVSPGLMPLTGSMDTLNSPIQVFLFRVNGGGVVITPHGFADPTLDVHVNETKLTVTTGVPRLLSSLSSTTTFRWLLVVVFFTVITY